MTYVKSCDLRILQQRHCKHDHAVHVSSQAPQHRAFYAGVAAHRYTDTCFHTQRHALCISCALQLAFKQTSENRYRWMCRSNRVYKSYWLTLNSPHNREPAYFLSQTCFFKSIRFDCEARISNFGFFAKNV